MIISDLPAKDRWGVADAAGTVLWPKKIPFVKEDLLDLPLLCSRQAVERGVGANESFANGLAMILKKLNIVTTFNLVYNAAIMVEAGVGYAITIDKLVNTAEHSSPLFSAVP